MYVDGWRLNLGGIDYVVRSSNCGGPAALAATDWPPATYAQFVSTMRSGADKGRVLCLARVDPFTRTEEPVAVLPYHLQSTKELLVKAAGASVSAKTREPDFLKILLAVADAVVRRGSGGGGRLVWDVARGNQTKIADLRALGFTEAGTDAGRRRLQRKTR